MLVWVALAVYLAIGAAIVLWYFEGPPPLDMEAIIFAYGVIVLWLPIFASFLAFELAIRARDFLRRRGWLEGS